LKEKKYFLFILCIMILLAFSFGRSYAQEQSYSLGAVSGGYMTSLGTGSALVSTNTTDSNFKNYMVVSGKLLPGGYGSSIAGGINLTTKYARNFDWVYNSEKEAPADKSSEGKNDGDTYSSKGVLTSATVLQNTTRIGQEHSTAGYSVYKTYLSFDTSGVPADADITSVDLVYYAKSVQSNKDFYIQLFKSVYVDPLWNSDWGAVVGPQLETPDSRIIVTGPDFKSESDTALAIANPDTCKNVIHIDLNKDVTLIKKGGITKIALVSSRSTEMSPPDDDSKEYVEIYSPNAVKTLRPSLEIKYSGDVLQTKPVLGWLTGDPIFKNGGASTDTLEDGENIIIFKVRYISNDGALGTPPREPDGHQVWIDLDGDNKFESAGEKINMDPVDATDLDYTDGKDYWKKVTINSAGNHVKYQFYFVTASGKVAGGTPSSIKWFSAIQSSAKNSGSSNNLCFISSLKW